MALELHSRRMVSTESIAMMLYASMAQIVSSSKLFDVFARGFRPLYAIFATKDTHRSLWSEKRPRTQFVEAAVLN